MREVSGEVAFIFRGRERSWIRHGEGVRAAGMRVANALAAARQDGLRQCLNGR